MGDGTDHLSEQDDLEDEVVECTNCKGTGFIPVHNRPSRRCLLCDGEGQLNTTTGEPHGH